MLPIILLGVLYMYIMYLRSGWIPVVGGTLAAIFIVGCIGLGMHLLEDKK
jgi:hypothetical protein